MISRRTLTVGAIVWAVLGFIVGLTALPDVNPDAVVLFAVACAVGPLAALFASLALRNLRDRLAGLLLVISVVTPAVFAWPLNLAALVAGLAIIISPSKVIADRRVDRA
ncbi:MAG: hypothetical protein QOH53_2410 [Ilumatobacteraceae bacterium]